jgi:hypothetical protein
VVCKPGDVDGAAGRLGQCGEGSAVELELSLRCDRRLESKPGQLMAEGDTPSLGAEHAGGEAGVETLHRFPCNRLEQPEIRLRWDDRDRIERRSRLAAEPRGPREHGIRHGRRDGAVPRRQHFRHEERIPAGQPVELACIDFRRAGEIGDGLRRERWDREPVGLRKGRQLAEEDAERMNPIELVVPVGREHEQRRLPQLAREQPQHVERRLVRPVDVLDDDDRRRARSRQPEERGDHRGRALIDGGLELAAGLLGDIEERPQRPRREQRVTTTPQHARRTPRLRAECTNRRRLAHPGLPGDEHEPAAPRGGLCQGVAQVAENRIALQEPRSFCRNSHHHLILNVPFSPINPTSVATRAFRDQALPATTIDMTFCRCLRCDAAGAFSKVCGPPLVSKLSGRGKAEPCHAALLVYRADDGTNRFAGTSRSG